VTQRGDEATSPSARLTVDYAIAHILAESRTSDEAIQNILAVIATTLGWDLGAIWEVERDVDLLHCVQTWGAPNVQLRGFDEYSKRIRLAPGVGLPGRVWASGEPAWIEDLSKDENFPRVKAAEAAGFRSAFAFPIRSEARVLGVIEFFTRERRGPEGDLLSLVSVLGDQIGQFMERRQVEEEVRQSEALKAAMLESALDAVIAIDHAGTVLEFNPAAEKIFGCSRADAIGREMAPLIIPPALRDRHRRGLERFLAGGEGTLLGKRLELTGMRADGSEFPAEVTISRIGTDDPPKFIGYVRDISERKQNEQALEFIARASAVLDESLELDAVLEALAKLTVPYLADGCQVDVLEPDGSIRRAAAAAADPALQPVVDELMRHRIDSEGPHPIARAARTGEMQVVPEITEPFLREISATDAYYRALRQWPAHSVVVVPLKSMGTVHGTVSLASFSRDRTYGPREIALIEELARRAASAIANAPTFEERRRAGAPSRKPRVAAGGEET
jgi:PAS domain S-box-containing protein